MQQLFLILVAAITMSACSDGNDTYIEPEPFVPTPPLSTSVMTVSGPIEGVSSERAVSWSYYGIPYAAPPVGKLRWKAPRPAEPWSEIRDASALPDFCPQFLYFTNEFAGEEDCLYLNVFRPQTQERNLPVFVWIHGGGNRNGDTGQGFPVYDGARLAERGNLLVVTVQYRLGALGWLYSPVLGGDNDLDASGNYGTLDIIESLQWVQANAEAFGGDPDNVTIAGESAGAANVLTLVISNQTNGLFHRGIIQSLGGGVTPAETALDEFNALVDDLMALQGVPDVQPFDEELAEYLRGVDPETLLATANTHEIVGDGVVIPVAGYDLLDSGNFTNKVPLLLGTNKDEQKLYTNPLGFNSYPDGPEELREAVGRYGSDAWRVTGADDLATRLRGNSDMPELYVYRFNWGSPDENGYSPLPGNFGATAGAIHSGEISFMMGNEDIFIFADYTPLLFTEDNATSRATMSDIMVGYWSSFAYNGDPNGNSLPIWEPWGNAEGDFKAVTLSVNYDDDSVRVEPDPTVLTAEQLYESANANLKGDVLKEVLDFLDGWFGDN